MRAFCRVMAFVLMSLGVALILLGIAGCSTDPGETVWQSHSTGVEAPPPPQQTEDIGE
jgi:hypothetical protein